MRSANTMFSEGLKRLLQDNPAWPGSKSRAEAANFLAAQEKVAALVAQLVYPMERVADELRAGSLMYFREGSDIKSGSADRKVSYRFAGVRRDQAAELDEKLTSLKVGVITQDQFEAWAVPFLKRFTFDVIELFAQRALPPPAVGVGSASLKHVRWRLAAAIDKAGRIRSEIAAGNLCLVAELALKRRGRFPGVLVDDLFSSGYSGLLLAINRYDPAVCMFSTYAFKWIQQAIDRNAMKMNNAIRVPIGMQEKSAKLYWESGANGHEAPLAKNGLPIVPQVQSLDQQLVENGDSLRDIIPDESAEDPSRSVELNESAQRLVETLRKLDPLRQLVIALRFDVGDAAGLMQRFIRAEAALSRARARKLLDAGAVTADEPARLRVIDASQKMDRPVKRNPK